MCSQYFLLAAHIHIYIQKAPYKTPEDIKPQRLIYFLCCSEYQGGVGDSSEVDMFESSQEKITTL